MSNPIYLTLDSEAFNGLKLDFQVVLNNTIATMQMKDVEHASITIKLDVGLTPAATPNIDAPDSESERDITIPMFKYNVAAEMKTKSEKKGIAGGPDYELVWDKEKHVFAMKPIPTRKPKRDTNQATLFDDDEEEYDG